MSYNRNREIPNVIPVYPSELATDLMSRCRLVAKLKRACAAEWQRGVDGHWTYDKGRHQGMINVLDQEIADRDALWMEQHGL